ncbi:sulfite exporter TauE/SafE family protein [Leucobacter sp. UT-8R-CII-1-4]|uniref:sulfite exporter TauE/SafE family protein n=1 Tax=Leucobacter sp. UT-8R-CII-1-4 TaxID=3040075 RepID=UPI0024A7C0E7|nr:sulfite exporter TauE/SafE family protein [Leucobacter sp. UT-8R-CII-1-4]MDI6022381.1 sulfite exporter TauE/SafE family protein [Leucobacter sp. UT-8R-CII-1-4]
MDSVTIIVLLLIGILTGITTVMFGFGGGFVTVPVILWADAAVGSAAGTVAVATSAVVMVVNAITATAATPRSILTGLKQRVPLLLLLALGGLLGALLAIGVPAEVASWGFVCYVAITIVDGCVRPGFIRPANGSPTTSTRVAIPTVLGAPIGAIASFLGVGGSVMTVPMLRRSGLPMAHAAALANPLTLAISVPASAVFLLSSQAQVSGAIFAVGIVDLGAAALLLCGAIPVIIVLRRRPPRLNDRAHAWIYLALLALVLIAMVVPLLQ